ncbi:MAG: N-acetylmuramoyl-L-alanine amidase [Pseudomonadota bacterium]
MCEYSTSTIEHIDEDYHSAAELIQGTAPRAGHLRIERRRFLQWLSAPAILALLPHSAVWAAGVRLAAARLWPSNEYTRLTLETNEGIRHRLRLLKNPDRLVIDLDNFTMSPELQKLAQRVSKGHDRYLKSIRFGTPEAGNLRMVLDLSEAIQPQVFTLKPIADYRYRLVIDLYPLVPYDPLLSVVEQEALRNNVDAAKSTPQLTDKIADRAPHTSTSATTSNATSSKSGAKEDPDAYQGDLLSLIPKENLEDSKGGIKKPEKIGKSPSLAKLNSGSDHESPSLGLKKSSGKMMIAIDPGHGGEDPGAIGQQQTYEKNITLAVGLKLRSALENHPNIRTIMTRDADYFVPLQQRVQKARRAKADLFISIHADAFIKPNVKGSSIFILSEHGASSAAARFLAQKENEADLIGGLRPSSLQDATVARLLLDMSQTATINDSLKLAQAVLKEMGEINTLHTSRVEQAGFAVLKAPDIPSILVETAFISNLEEEQKLRDEQHQHKIALAITEGVQAYAAKNPRLA